MEKTSVVRARELKTGIEVKSGLNDGEVVVVAPTPELRPGQAVTAVPTH